MTKNHFESSVEYDLLHHPLGAQLYAKYDLLDCLYTNDTSSVYKLIDKGTGSYYSLKAISKSPMDFTIDFDAIKAPQHPQIATLVSYFETDAFYYLIKPYIAGLTLKEWVAENGPLSDTEIRDILVQICDILNTFHRHKIIYRDLKPHNLIYHNGQITLIDLASMRHHKPRATSDTAYIGTVGYAAPEQFGFGQSDQRTDIYNLGMTLYFLIRGEEALNQQEMVESMKHMKEHLATNPASSLRQRLLDIVIKSTYLDPDKRFASVDILLDALHAPEHSKVSLPYMQTQDKKSSKHRFIPLFTGLILVSVILFAFLLAYGDNKAVNNDQRSEPITENQSDGVDDNPLSPSLPASSITNKGIVLSPDGQALDGKTQGEMIIELRSLSGMAITQSYCQSDGSFSLDLDEVGDGDYHIRLLKDFQDGFASPPAHKVTVTNHLIDSESLELKLSKPQINGTVLNQEGQPFTEGMTVFYEVDYILYFLAKVDQDGHFLIGGLVPDQYDLLFHPNNGDESLHMTLAIDDQVDQVNIQLK